MRPNACLTLRIVFCSAVIVPAIVRGEDRAQQKFWSFRRLQDVSIPVSKDERWSQTAVDCFIRDKMIANDKQPAPLASRDRLARRAALDIIGLPLSPDETEQLLDDTRPDAWEQFFERLLANPHYGERWGRHWLDVVRFAESYGFEHNLDNNHAWHYRDFVIRALNDDMPFDQFVRWQLAGDELAGHDPDARIATGFLTAGVHNADFAKVRVEQERYDELDDHVSTIGAALLGLSLGCARCHEHRYDPITQEDYFRFAAIFERTIRGEVDIKRNGSAVSMKVLVAGEGLKPLARIYNPGPAFFKETWYLNRGEVGAKEHKVKPGFPEALVRPGVSFTTWHKTESETNRESPTTMRRAALARWLTDHERGAGALLARVIVNRIWQHHFGRGIVATPNDFGSRGARPTHPELLEWLAGELIRSRWSLKHIHRLILNSLTYHQSVLGRERTQLDDQLFCGHAVRRLESEIIRDTMLALSGTWDDSMYGAGTLDQDQPRRSVYFRVKRSQLTPLMSLFDCPDALQSTGRRSTTTVAPQALALMNSPRIERLALGFARRLLQSQPMKNDQVIQKVWKETLGRTPGREEVADARLFLKRQSDEYANSENNFVDPLERAVTDLCQALFCLNEFIYVE